LSRLIPVVFGPQSKKCKNLEPIYKREKMDWKNAEPNEIVCHCFKVEKKDIVTAIQNGANTLSAVTRETSAGGSCGVCISDIKELIEIYSGTAAPANANTNPVRDDGKSIQIMKTVISYIKLRHKLTAIPVRIKNEKRWESMDEIIERTPFEGVPQRVDFEDGFGVIIYDWDDVNPRIFREIKMFYKLEKS
jgi:bacterioferritin-associated ferredoxin